ncbi:hypothetical protein QA649_33215 [Bradyrhizobium sp. CB1717]|uniref:hypothetical protein n=1 Tax=Bradyrhizobium sp. CB1717 TaxID=3039154 RepID=UPI0024B19AE2|nr:hypothetical protein [Bradyrhizobium sp. CB1717]WFU22907.1 hypothetical protein QA649_33215 [Bradyrhizobium sp. CB1717]
MIDKGFLRCVATASAAAIKLTRRAKHWQDAIVADRGVNASASAATARISSGLTYEV